MNSLRRATEKALTSIAFPAISTGIFGFPKDRCARIMLSTVRDYLSNETTTLERIIFCLWSAEDLAIFQQALQALGS
jgi:O-acetyl-ADP-ribose deacetylase